MNLRRYFGYLVLAVCAFSLTACAGMWADAKQYRQSGTMLRKRDFTALVTQTEKNRKKLYKNKDRVLEYLDLGMLYHYQGDYTKSNQMLEQAELAMEDLFTKSVSKAALSLLLNDNVLDYSGEDYEDIYTNAFKALNYLHEDKFDDAFVEIRRINFKLDMLQDKYVKMADAYNHSKDKKADFKAGTNKFVSSALGRYLSMIIYQQEGKPDDALIDYNKLKDAFTLQPDIYNFNPPKLYDPLLQMDLPMLHVVSLTGRSPRKENHEFHIATSVDALHIVTIDQDIEPFSVFWPGIKPNTYFKFVMPYMTYEPSEMARVVVRIDSLSYDLSKIEDIGNVAVQTFKVKEPILLLKNATRAVLKGVAANAIKKEMKKKNDDVAGDLLSIGTDIALFLSEKADLRTARFFPSEVLIADIPLPAGVHDISIEYFDTDGTLLYTDRREQVEVSPHKLNLLESWQLQ